MKTAEIQEAGVTDLLAAQIDLLHQGYKTLASSSTLKDLAARFAAVVRRSHPGSEVCLLYRPAQGETWQDLSLPSVRHPKDFLSAPDDQAGAVVVLDQAMTEIRVVIPLADHSVAGMVLSYRAPEGQFTETDLLSVRLSAHLFSNAYQAMISRQKEKGLIFSLNHRVLQLNSLIDTGIEVARLTPDSTPEQMALQRAASLTNASRGMVTVTGASGQPRVYCFPAGGTEITVSAPFDGARHINTSFSYAGCDYAFELFDKESRSGPIAFDETDQLLLDALARQVHASLENRYLHAQALEKQKIEQDMAVAASIQQRILPASLPVVQGYDLAGVNIPSKSVGGDYYDCIPLPDGRYALVIADVAGKGIPAALLVSSLHASLAAYIESGTPLVDLAVKLNRVIGHASTDDKFITAFFAILAPSTGELEALNAGHTATFLLRGDNTVCELSTGGIPLGMLDMDFPFQSERVTLQPGDRLLLYTDGVTEAMDADGGLYDTAHPLKDFVLANRPETAKAFIQALIRDIKGFTGKAEQNDDITALYLLRHS